MIQPARVSKISELTIPNISGNKIDQNWTYSTRRLMNIAMIILLEPVNLLISEQLNSWSKFSSNLLLILRMSLLLQEIMANYLVNVCLSICLHTLIWLKLERISIWIEVELDLIVQKLVLLEFMKLLDHIRSYARELSLFSCLSSDWLNNLWSWMKFKSF